MLILLQRKRDKEAKSYNKFMAGINRRFEKFNSFKQSKGK